MGETLLWIPCDVIWTSLYSSSSRTLGVYRNILNKEVTSLEWLYVQCNKEKKIYLRKKIAYRHTFVDCIFWTIWICCWPKFCNDVQSSFFAASVVSILLFLFFNTLLVKFSQGFSWFPVTKKFLPSNICSWIPWPDVGPGSRWSLPRHSSCPTRPHNT